MTEQSQISHSLYVPKLGQDDYLSEVEEDIYYSNYVSDDDECCEDDSCPAHRKLNVYCAEVNGGVGVFFEKHEILNVSVQVNAKDKNALALVAILKALEQCKSEDTVIINTSNRFAVNALQRLDKAYSKPKAEDGPYEDALLEILAQAAKLRGVEFRYVEHEHRIPGVRKAHVLANESRKEERSVEERVKCFFDPWTCAC